MPTISDAGVNSANQSPQTVSDSATHKSEHETADIVIIGGGAIGLSIAYHLSQRQAGKIILLERHQLTSGTSWHAAGIVGPLRATPNMTRLASYATELFPKLETETGLATGYRVTGGYWLARERDRLDEMERIAAVGKHFGLKPMMVSGAEVQADLPVLEPTGVIAALYVPEDASVNPVDLCMAYARGAKNRGVEIREGVEVQRICRTGVRTTGVVLMDGTRIDCDCVVIATGAWSKKLAATVGVDLPLQPVEHMYIVTEPRPEFEGFPVLRDLDRNFYIKGDTGKLLIGVFEENAKCWEPHGVQGNTPFLEMAEDWNMLTPFMEHALALLPTLSDTGIQFYMNGPESFVADTQPLMGATPQVDGLYIAAGFNSLGIMSSAGVGKVLADWICDGRADIDTWEVDIARIDPKAADEQHLQARMQEAVADQFNLHYPFKQPKAGRNLRCSPLHEQWATAGAHFGLTAGWERGLWFVRDESERNLTYSVGAQPWWPIVAREAAEMEQGTVLIDLTPFTKITVRGADALAGLNYLSTANLAGSTGQAIYTQLLNERGGIEADVTIVRSAPDQFEITSSATTRWRDLAYLRRQLNGDASIHDRTEDSCIVGVMGQGSRACLRQLAQGWTDAGFGHVTQMTIAGQVCRATRLSFVGELGWELEVANANAPEVFDALAASGAKPMGMYAVDACRIEKGYRHWGHDIGPMITPLEAGLGFTVDWSKAFIGKSVLKAQRANGLQQQLVQLVVQGKPLILHDEPVWEDGRVVGFTTSGGRGARTGLDLAFALIEAAQQPLGVRGFEVEIGGKFYSARGIRRAVFDPSNLRMRG